MFNLYICLFCESIVRAETPLATCLTCNDYKGLSFIGTGIDMTCHCGLAMCPECDPDFYVDMERDFADMSHFYPNPLPEPPF